MKQYRGVKTVKAEPCTLDEFINSTGIDPYKGRDSKSHHTPDDEGYKVMYTDDYVSWSPKDVFEASYHPVDSVIDRMEVEYNELQARIDKLDRFINSKGFNELDIEERLLLVQQHAAMVTYRSILGIRIESYRAKNR